MSDWNPALHLRFADERTRPAAGLPAQQRSAAIDLWHTAYRHAMEGLRPFLDALPLQFQSGFLAEYGRRINAACGERADGRRLLAFPRLPIVAQRKP